MRSEDRPAFEISLAELFAAIDKPLGEAQRSAFWKGLAQMSLLEFSRCRDKIIDDLADGETPRKFGVSDIWVAKGKLRAAAPAMPQDDGWRGDDWDAAANMHLLKHIRTCIAGNSRCYGRGPSYEAMTSVGRMREKTLDASPEFVRNVAILVSYKNRWADMMRVSADQNGVPIDEQQDIWRECMRLANEAITAERIS